MFKLFIFTFLTKSRLLFWSKPEQLIKNTKIMKHFLLSIYFLRLLIIVSIFLSYLILHHRISSLHHFFRLKSYRAILILEVASLFLLRSYFDHKNLVAYHQFVKLFHYFFSNLLRLQQNISNSSKFQLHSLFFKKRESFYQPNAAKRIKLNHAVYR